MKLINKRKVEMKIAEVPIFIVITPPTPAPTAKSRITEKYTADFESAALSRV